MRSMTTTTISNLQLACHYWELARRLDSRQAAAAYYNKAYTILRKEMGEDNCSTLAPRIVRNRQCGELLFILVVTKNSTCI